MLHWKVWSYFCNFTCIEKSDWFLEKLWKICNTDLIGQCKVLPMRFPQKRTDAFVILGMIEGFFKLESKQLACFPIITRWQNHSRTSIEQRCSVSSKVQALTICCESGLVSMKKSFESTETWRILSCNAAVLVVFVVLTLSTTRRKHWCKYAWIPG